MTPSKPSSEELDFIMFSLSQGAVNTTEAKAALRQYIDREVLKGRIDELEMVPSHQGADLIPIIKDWKEARLSKLKAIMEIKDV